jgi:hypothetical protein
MVGLVRLAPVEPLRDSLGSGRAERAAGDFTLSALMRRLSTWEKVCRTRRPCLDDWDRRSGRVGARSAAIGVDGRFERGPLPLFCPSGHGRRRCGSDRLARDHRRPGPRRSGKRRVRKLHNRHRSRLTRSMVAQRQADLAREARSAGQTGSAAPGGAASCDRKGRPRRSGIVRREANRGHQLDAELQECDRSASVPSAVRGTWEIGSIRTP